MGNGKSKLKFQLIVKFEHRSLLNQYLTEAVINMNLVENISVNSYLLKFIKRNTRKRCEICSKLTIKTPERCHNGQTHQNNLPATAGELLDCVWTFCDVVLVILLLTYFTSFSSVSIVDFKQVNVTRVFKMQNFPCFYFVTNIITIIFEIFT